MPSDDDRRAGGGDSYCYYHPRHPALVRCGACGKYLCPDCIYYGPVGTRCAECLYGIELHPVSRARRIGAGIAALVAAVVVGCAIGYLGWLNWLTGAALGLLVGQVARTTARGISVPSVQAAAGVTAALGVYAAALVEEARAMAVAGVPVSVAGVMSHIGVVDWAVAGALAAGMAVYWVWRG